jgi:AcrR family transcriptional regulator
MREAGVHQENGSPVISPRRQPTQGGYPRGHETRERIIQAAFVVFAEEGYVGASTRRIAAASGVNTPALRYYFDSKEGLHRACGQFIVDTVLQELKPAFERATIALAGDRQDAIDGLCYLVETLAQTAIPTAYSEKTTRFVARCDSDRIGPASGMVEAGIVAPLHATAARLVARALGGDPGAADVRLRTVMIMCELHAVLGRRDQTLAFIGWDDFSTDNIGIVKQAFSEHVRRLLAF